MRTRNLIFSICVLLLACSDARPTPGLTLTFDPQVAPVVDYARLPFPSNLYRDGDGNLELEPGPQLYGLDSDMMLPALASLNAFGTQQTVFFGIAFDEGLRRDVILNGLAAPEALTAAARLVNVDEDSAGFGTTSPVEVHLDPELELIAVTPFLGTPLDPGTTYAVILLQKELETAIGKEIRLSPAFIRMLTDAPVNDAERAAIIKQREPLLQAALATDRLLSDLAVGTVYTTQRPTDDLDAILAQIEAAPVPKYTFRPTFFGDGITGATLITDLYGVPTDNKVGRDNDGGILHTFVSQTFVGEITLTVWSDARNHSSFQYDGQGHPRPRRKETAEFILTIPDCDQPADGYPVVVVQHGLGDNKEFVLGLANSMSAECLVTIGMDAVGHAARSRRPRDLENNVTGDDNPDGIDDGFPFAGLDQVFLLNPIVARTNLIDTAAGLIQLARTVRFGTWTLPEGALRPDFKINPDKIGYAGQSMGGIVGSIFTGTTTDITASVINVGGGNYTRIASEGPIFAMLTPLLAVGIDLEITRTPRHDHPSMALLQAVLEGADPINYGPRFTLHPPDNAPRKHVLLQAAYQDQLVPNSATAGLAKAAGYPLLANRRPRAPLYQSDPRIELPTGRTLDIEGERFATGIVVFDPADHNFIGGRCTTVMYDFEPPYGEIPDPYDLANPTAQAQGQMARFLKSSLDDDPEILPISGGIPDPDDC